MTTNVGRKISNDEDQLKAGVRGQYGIIKIQSLIIHHIQFHQKKVAMNSIQLRLKGTLSGLEVNHLMIILHNHV